MSTEPDDLPASAMGAHYLSQVWAVRQLGVALTKGLGGALADIFVSGRIWYGS